MLNDLAKAMKALDGKKVDQQLKLVILEKPPHQRYGTILSRINGSKLLLRYAAQAYACMFRKD